MYPLLRHVSLCTHWCSHFLLLLFARHWMIGLTNLGATALLGLGLVRAAERWHLFGAGTQVILYLRRGVLLVALAKGALYLILGESMRASANHWWIIGFQFPDPAETAGLLVQTGYSIWQPTEISHEVTQVLLGVATVYLFLRAVQLFLARRAFGLWISLGTGPPSIRSSMLLARAADRLRLPFSASLPALVELDLPGQSSQFITPMLLGLVRPVLLLPPQLSELLSDAELEMVLRHELAHLIRRDHWWRWLLLWVTDVGGLTVLAFRLKAVVVEIEERLCDRLAVQSPEEALLLASALMVATQRSSANRQADPDLDTKLAIYPFVPLLFGGYGTSWQPAILQGRLAGLLAWSQELAALEARKKSIFSLKEKPISGRGIDAVITRLTSFIKQFCRSLIAAFFFLLLVVILYVKVHLTLNLQ